MEGLNHSPDIGLLMLVTCIEVRGSVLGMHWNRVLCGSDLLRKEATRRRTWTRYDVSEIEQHQGCQQQRQRSGTSTSQWRNDICGQRARTRKCTLSISVVMRSRCAWSMGWMLQLCVEIIFLFRAGLASSSSQRGLVECRIRHSEGQHNNALDQ